MFNMGNILVDRRVYPFKGSWRNPQQDIHENIYYFVSKPKTFVADYDNGRETMRPVCEITVFGCFQIIKHDKMKLQDGTIWQVEAITLNELEANILIRDMVKPRVQSMTLTLAG